MTYMLFRIYGRIRIDMVFTIKIAACAASFLTERHGCRCRDRADLIEKGREVKKEKEKGSTLS